MPWQLQVARILALLLVGTAILRLFQTYLQYRQLRRRLSRLARNHVVICGLGWKARQYARHFRQQGLFVILLEKDELNPLIDSVFVPSL